MIHFRFVDLTFLFLDDFKMINIISSGISCWLRSQGEHRGHSDQEIEGYLQWIDGGDFSGNVGSSAWKVSSRVLQEGSVDS